MFLVSGPDLVLGACKAGIIGAAPAGTARSAEEFADWLELFDKELAEWSAQTGRQPAPYACNLSVRKGEKFGTSRFAQDLETCRRHRVKLVITANGDPSKMVPEIHAWGGLVFHDVTTLRHAEKAIAAGVDGLIVICNGGGGHGGIVNPFALIPQIRRIFDGWIVLAGTISDGRSIRAAQVLGADLCYLGTRFIATQESMAPQAYKEMIVAAQTGDILYTPTFTRGVPANFMKPSIRANGFDPDSLPPHTEAPTDRRAWRDIWAAGQGVGLIDDIPSVEDLVDRLAAEYQDACAEPTGRSRGAPPADASRLR
ncbi:2-nitropropane dioxygenase [Frigidibacter albus]|nr:nitronate monooxygenase family protein [Frigidibacter albus]GGH62793.1 2-nitropropane dioxygenase [Frigidibacter albus]